MKTASNVDILVNKSFLNIIFFLILMQFVLHYYIYHYLVRLKFLLLISQFLIESLSFPHVFCGNLLRKLMRFLHSQEWQQDWNS